LKCILSKEFLDNKRTNFVKILPEIIDSYSNTPDTALDNITPNDAISDPKKREHAMHLNIEKGEQNGFTTYLKPGDEVRIDDTSLFKKGTKRRWSDDVHVQASEKTVVLSDGTTQEKQGIRSTT